MMLPGSTAGSYVDHSTPHELGADKNSISLINNLFVLCRYLLCYLPSINFIYMKMFFCLLPDDVCLSRRQPPSRLARNVGSNVNVITFLGHRLVSTPRAAAKRRRNEWNHKRLEVRRDGCWPFVPYHIHIVYNNFNCSCSIQCTKLHSITADVHIPF